MIHWRLTCLTCVLLLFTAGPAPAQDDAAKSQNREKSAEAKDAAQNDAPVEMNALEQKFADQLSSSALVGHFLVDGKGVSAKPERYEIESARKLRDDYWVITARIKYGKYDLKVPVTLKVLWAGDTPVMSLTDLTIPVLGTFTARVLFYGDRYVGTWQHGDAGGHMFGHVEKLADSEAPDSDAAAETQ